MLNSQSECESILKDNIIIFHLLSQIDNSRSLDGFWDIQAQAITTKRITERMKELYGLHVHRTTVPGDLSALAAAGYDIQSSRGRIWHFHYEDRTFSLAELKLLIDAVQASKFITKGKSAELIQKLSSLTSKKNADHLKRSVKISGRAKTENEKGYYIVDAVNHAMNIGRKISFLYFMYDVQKQTQLKNDGCPYTVSPYDLVWDGDCYYLIGYCDERSSIRIFRADRIASAPEVLAEAVVVKPDDYSLERYTTESFRMFSVDEPVEVTLRCHEKIMNSFLDHFGLDTETIPQVDGTFLTTVRVCVSPLFYRWVFGAAGAVQIISPQDVKAGYSQMLLDAVASLRSADL